jgi:hypothetical protein
MVTRREEDLGRYLDSLAPELPDNWLLNLGSRLRACRRSSAADGSASGST